MAARDGEGLSCDFPQKWMSADGLSAWAIFSVYGGSAKQGINAHDRFNLVEVSFLLAMQGKIYQSRRKTRHANMAPQNRNRRLQ